MTSQITEARQAVIAAINNGTGLTGNVFKRKYLFESTETLEDIPQPGLHELPAILVDHSAGADGQMDLSALGVHELQVTIEVVVWTRYWNAEPIEDLIQKLLLAIRVNSADVKLYRPSGVKVSIKRIRLAVTENVKGPAAMQGRISIPLAVRYC